MSVNNTLGIGFAGRQMPKPRGVEGVSKQAGGKPTPICFGLSLSTMYLATRLFLLRPSLRFFVTDWVDGWTRAGFGFRASNAFPGWLRMRGKREKLCLANHYWESPKKEATGWDWDDR